MRWIIPNAVNNEYIYRKISFMPRYIYQTKEWPRFTWDQEKLLNLLTQVSFKQGKLLGMMQSLGYQLQSEATLQALTLDVLKSSEIEGEILNSDQVRSSIARRLGIDIAGLIPADRYVEGVVEMMLDATQNYKAPLTEERLFDWHAALFPTRRTGMQRIVIGAWRDNDKTDPMQVVSGPMGKEKVHFEAPGAEIISDEMTAFLKWFNEDETKNAVINAAIAHLWFVTIHPFDDGNGRIARAITDMQLGRTDKSQQRFYSMSAQIRNERNGYYSILEKTQKGSVDITEWLQWFLTCLDRSISATDQTLANIMLKAKFWDKYSKETFNDRQKIMLHKLLDGFEGKFNSSKWAKITKTSSDTALRDITNLLLRNILIKENTGGRSTSYVLKSDIQ